MATPRNNSVVRAFAILAAFDERNAEMTASAVAERTGFNTATTHRFLKTLEDIGVIARTAQGRFRLGLRLADLGARVTQHEVIRDAVAADALALADALGETVHVAVMIQDQPIVVANAQPERNFSMDAPAGRHLPAYSTAYGKVLLSGYAENRLSAYLASAPLAQLTENTITDADALRAELDTVRRGGFSVDREETEIGIRAVAVPIVDSDGTVRAALATSGPAARLTEDRTSDVVVALSPVAARITDKLYPPSEFADAAKDAAE